MKIAIIGSGISGLGAAYLLNPHHDITVFEKNDYIGGHSRTITVPDGNGKKTPVDTGFIVFNKRNYFHLTRLFERLNVTIEKSDMSFGVSIKDDWLEYGSKGMFAQKRNFLRPQFWKMIWDVLKFNKRAKSYIEKNPSATLQQCLGDLNTGRWFREYYLQAMGAAIWSCSVETILKFPASSFIRFFDNHGLLTVNDHPQWYTVSGGSREYVTKLTDNFKDKIQLKNGAAKITKRNDGRLDVLTANGQTETFDKVVFACHADEALAMIDNADDMERNILTPFGYQDNKVVVHNDISFMPHRKGAWASWVYLSDTDQDKNESVSLTYWMNNLQNMVTDKPLLVTLNPGRMPDADLILDTHEFSHPVFDKGAVNSQSKIADLQGHNNLYYCGAYQRYGFHEDGLLSAVNMVKTMGIEIPWE
jgi:predicted NAD/FAD-binding protein